METLQLPPLLYHYDAGNWPAESALFVDLMLQGWEWELDVPYR